jgi:putative SOS response-associated peptidase YedK
MCGRVIRTTPKELLASLFDLTSMPEQLPVRYNLAPTDSITVIRRPHHLELLRWGLSMPDRKMAGVNVRVESLGAAMYRDSVRTRRCVVVVDGFYEWRALAGKKLPFVVQRGDRAPMLMAGIYDATGGAAVITMPAAGAIKGLHERMPALLPYPELSAWLDTSVDAREVLRRSESGALGLTCHSVSPDVNKVANDDPHLLYPVPEPVDEGPRQRSLFG